MCFRVTILVLKAFVQRRDILLHIFNELSLVLANSTPNLGTDKERIEFGEHSEHLVGVLCCRQTVSQSGDDGVFNTGGTFIVGNFFLYP